MLLITNTRFRTCQIRNLFINSPFSTPCSLNCCFMVQSTILLTPHFSLAFSTDHCPGRLTEGKNCSLHFRLMPSRCLLLKKEAYWGTPLPSNCDGHWHTEPPAWVDKLFSGMLCSPQPLSNVSSPTILAQIPSSLRCPAGCNQSTLHSFAAFYLLHLFDTFHLLLYIVFIFIH